jgi:arabinose-5-phosphate isomerase
MNNLAEFIDQAKEVLNFETAALRVAVTNLDEQFARAIDMILSMQGRLIVTGMGKPGYIAQKIAATLMSTGTPACYLHPAEGIHGDLGMITKHDIVLMLSNSGETREILNIIPAIRRINVPIIAICGQPDSTLAKHADVLINAFVDKEACPLNLAPTASTTVALALGDALAVVLMKSRHFTAEDFALFHPGGTLGKKLLMTVGEMMHSGMDNPKITTQQTLCEALLIMTDKRLGATSVVDDDGKLMGLITDGDIRRYLAKGEQILTRPAADIMTTTPLVISQNQRVSEAVDLMGRHRPNPITLLPVLDETKRVVGMVHLTDLVRNNI